MESKYRSYRNDMGIGLGGVMAEVAWLKAGQNEEEKENGVPLDDVIEGLMGRYKTHSNRALRSVDMAIKCGVVYEESGRVYLKSSPR